MIKLPYGLIAGAVVLLVLCIGWFTTAQSLRVKKAELAAAAEREARWAETVKDCQANRAELEERFDDLAEKITQIANQKERLQGALDDAVIRSREIAEAREALEVLREEHESLVNRAVPLTACQTYEMVLAAFAGGGP